MAEPNSAPALSEPSAPAPAPAPAPEQSLGAKVSEQTSSVVSGLKDKLSAFGATPSKILIGLILVAAAGFAVAYALYWMINRVILNKKAYLVPGTKVPVLGTEYRRFDGSEIPKATNGKRMTFAFWIYINDINRFQGTQRHVLHRGDQSLELSGSSITTAAPSPVVFLDSTKNRLTVVFTPVKYDDEDTRNMVDSTTAGAVNLTAAEKTAYLRNKYGITIDYIPIQRWVHVAVVVNENANGGTITAYVDSEIVKNVSTGGQSAEPIAYIKAGATRAKETVKIPVSFANLNLDKVADIWTGGSPSESVGPGFSGLVGKVSFFNYDLNAKDVYNDYMSGPVDNMLAKLGLPAYGIRSPVYRVG